MRAVIALVPCVLAALLTVGCVVYSEPPRRVVVETPVPPDPGPQDPVIDTSLGEVVEVEPPPVERVYVYEAGYPPGVYFYNNYYWYGGYRYRRDVFINRVVNVNIRENRYIDVARNRARGRVIEQQHRQQFARNGGRTGLVGGGNHHDVTGGPRRTPEQDREAQLRAAKEKEERDKAAREHH